MKRALTIVLLAMAMVGPFSGKASEDRVNLWPIVGYDNGALDVIWPLGHFKDSDDWRFFPVLKKSDCFAVFPELWFTDIGFGVFPFFSRYDFRSVVLFPVIWWFFDGDEKLNSFFPLYYYRYRSYNNRVCFWTLAGLGGYNTDADGRLENHWLFPLYLKEGDDFISIPYSRMRHNYDGVQNAFVFGLSGYTREADGHVSASWMFPLWDKDNRKFASLPYSCKWDGKGEMESWISLPLLSGGWLKDDVWHEEYLLGLGGRRIEQKSGFRSSWAVPFYYADSEGRLVTLLYGRNKESQWCFPFWYLDDNSFSSIFWCHDRDENGSLDFWSVPLLLTGGQKGEDGTESLRFLLGMIGMEWNGPGGRRASWLYPLYYENSDGAVITAIAGKNKDSSWVLPFYYADDDTFMSLAYVHERNGAKKMTRTAFPLLFTDYCKWGDGSSALRSLLYGHVTDSNGCVKTDYLFPLYHYDSGDFSSLLWGRKRHIDASESDVWYSTWWLTPFIGTYSGGRSGGWFFPLLHYCKENKLDSALARMDSPKIPDDIVFSEHIQEHTNWGGKSFSETNLLSSVSVDGHSNGSLLLLSRFSRNVWDYVESGNQHYVIRDRAERGNALFFSRTTDRTVMWDIASRERVRDKLESKTIALCGIFSRKSVNDPANNYSTSRTRILYKLWDYKSENGDVSVDVFPGFTYDSKKSGYTRTSFLLRLFRYENDPIEGRKIDFLFIPIWR